MIDTHCHLDFPQVSPKLSEIISQAKGAGINEFVVPATGRQNWQTLKKLSSQYQEIHVAYGIHPWFLDDFVESDLTELENVIKTEKCVAIGECGLDFLVLKIDKDLQKKVFVTQLELARKYNLPVIIHSRKAVADVLKLIKKYRISQGIMHGFIGSLEQAREFINLGFYIGVGTIVCNSQATRIRKVVANLIPENILLETDAPDQGSLLDLKKVLKAVANLHKISPDKLEVLSDANAKRCFNIR